MDETNKKEMMPKDQVAVILEGIRSDFKVFGEDLSSVKNKVNLLADDMDIVKSDIVDIKLELKIMNGKLDNKTEKETAIDHEKRIVRLENGILPKSAIA